MSDKPHNYALILARAFAVFLLVSAVLKALDYQAFLIQIAYYRVLHDPILIRIAGVIALVSELVIAVALWNFIWLRKVTIPATALMLAVYSGLIGFSWAFHGLEDCGCFGKFLQMSPLASLLKNAVLLGGLVWLWFKAGTKRGVQLSRRDLVTAGITLAVSALVVGFLAYRGPGNAPPGGSVSSVEEYDSERDGPFGKYRIEAESELIDLGHGEYVVAMLSMECEHCAATVPELNEISYQDDLPRLVALCFGDEDTFQSFLETNGPDFPMQLIDPLEFFNLIGDVPPRFVFVQDGFSIAHWDEVVPRPDEILDALFQ